MARAVRKSSSAKSERFEVRLQSRFKARVEKAALLSGYNLSEFTRRSVIDSAEAVIEAHERTQLTPADHAAFFEAMNAPQTTAALAEALDHHSQEVESL